MENLRPFDYLCRFYEVDVNSFMAVILNGIINGVIWSTDEDLTYDQIIDGVIDRLTDCMRVTYNA